MSLLIRVAFVFTSLFVGLVLSSGNPVLDAEDFDISTDEYFDGDEDVPDQQQVLMIPYLWKRGGFWTSHPSDFNPMRRPTNGQGNRNSKKSFEANPYHPLPRSVNQNQKNQRSLPQSFKNEDLEAMMEGLRDKRQSPGSFLLMKLGRIRNNKNENSSYWNNSKGRSRRRGRRQ